MARLVYASPRQRSVTAQAGVADYHDGMVYSAGLLQHGGQASIDLFSVQKGGTMLALKASGTNASTNAHQSTYTQLTTNFDQPSKLGNTIGDATFRGIGVTIESAAFTASTGAARSFGATMFEVVDILAKCTGELKIGNKQQMLAPLWAYPQLGGAAANVSTTGNAATVSAASNGSVPSGRRFRTMLPVGRDDTVIFTLGVANGASLAFSVTTADGQPTLVWCMILADLQSDVR